MAEPAPKKSEADKPVAAAPVLAGGGPRVDWKAIWPVPVLALGTLALFGGVIQGVLKAPKTDPAAPLAQVRSAVEAREFESAIQTVNDRLVPAITMGALTNEAAAETLILRARAILGGQAAMGVRLPENDRAAIADFERAAEFGAKLTPADLAEKAEAFAALGESKKAVDVARELPSSAKDRQLAILRKVVEANLAGEDVRYDQTLALLTELLDAEGATTDDRAWAVARQSELRLAMNYDEEAIAKLLVAIPRLENIKPERRGELTFLLGRAYYQAGQYDQARRQLDSARGFLPPHESLHGEATVLIGRIMQAGGQLDEAREEFQGVREQHAGSSAAVLAQLGLAETQAASGDDAAALVDYDGVIESLLNPEPARPGHEEAGGGHVEGSPKTPDAHAGDTKDLPKDAPKADEQGHAEGPKNAAHDPAQKGAAPKPRRVIAPRRDLNVEIVGRSLMDRYAERSSAGEHAGALPFVNAARRLFTGAGEPLPAEVLLGLGSSNRAVGMKILDEARTTPQGQLPVDRISPVTQAEAKRYLIEAGESFRDHASKVVVSDKTAYDQSTWNSADCFDLAADRENAKMAFSTYIQSAAGDDPRRPEARFRLAQILLAERDYGAAAAGYRQLIDAAAAGSSGPWADAALVPLARCYLLDDKPDNDAEAEALLLSALSGATIPPESEIYRAALVELGETMYAKGRYAEAIERLEEAVNRYRDHERFAVLTFKLADAHRLSAGELAEELKQAKPQRDREEMTVLREQRLREAARLYDLTLEVLAAKDRRKFTPMDTLAERNSTFARADVAFEQADYDRAIVLYDAARQKYSADPASLVAMVQIVNSYVAQEKWSEAVTANERARQQLAALPEQVWTSPDLPMERKHWERWLDAGAVLDRRLNSARAGAGGS